MGNAALRQRALLGRLASYAVMLLAFVIIGAPVYWMLSGSVKTTQQIYTFPPFWLPTHPRWHNFIDAWHAAPFGRFYINSIFLTVVGTAVKLINAVLTAYALVFLR